MRERKEAEAAKIAKKEEEDMRAKLDAIKAQSRRRSSVAATQAAAMAALQVMLYIIIKLCT